METAYILVLFAVAAVSLFLVWRYKPGLLKKYWKSLVIGFSAFFVLVFSVGKLWKKDVIDVKGDKRKEKLDDKIKDVNEEAEREITEAKVEEEKVTNALESIHKISDEEERLKRLSDLFNNTRRQ